MLDLDDVLPDAVAFGVVDKLDRRLHEASAAGWQPDWFNTTMRRTSSDGYYFHASASRSTPSSSASASSGGGGAGGPYLMIRRAGDDAPRAGGERCRDERAIHHGMLMRVFRNAAGRGDDEW